MRRFISTPTSLPTTNPLVLNILGAINRNQTRDKTLADGTPPTPPIVDQFWERLGYIPEKGFAQMTYGPAIGFPDTIAYLKERLGLDATHIFAPQAGIVQSADKALSIADSHEGFIALLTNTRGAEVLMTFPNNPDGCIPSLDEMKQVIAIANAHGHRLVLDMTYFNFVGEAHLENYKAVVSEIQSTANSYLMIASGSKALGITKYRTALVLGDSASLVEVREKSSKINSISAIALGEALKIENRDQFRKHLSHNVRENTRYILEILDGTLSRPIAELNTGLQKLYTLASKVPAGSIQFIPGEGALYGLLNVTEAAARTVMEEAAKENLALTPGAVFSGQPVADVDQLLKTPQTLYRVSLMANPE